MPRAVEFAEINSLPGSQPEPALRHQNLPRGSEHGGFDMGGRVAFAMTVLRVLPGHGFFQGVNHVPDHIGVGVFLDGDRRGGVRHVDGQNPVGPIIFLGGLLNLLSYVEELSMVPALDLEFNHGKLFMILVTGGNGFVGRKIVSLLLQQGHRVRIFSRKAAAKPVPGAEWAAGDILDAASLDRAMAGVRIVIHLVGIIAEKDGSTFEKIHVQGTRRVVAAARRAGVSRYLHMSALGARPHAASNYHRSKFAAEEIVRKSGLDWTIFRPAIIFGRGDSFVNLLAALMKLPFRQMPMIGDGSTLLEPIAVENVAGVFAHALTHGNAIGQTYELCGESITYRDMLVEIGRALELKPVVVPYEFPTLFAALPMALLRGARPAIFPVPVPLARAGAWIMGMFLPCGLTPPVTSDQIDMLEEDQKGDKEKAWAEFNFKPLPFREGIRKYLSP